MAVILLARRPFDVIGSASPIELCPYVVEVGSPHVCLPTVGGRPFARLPTAIRFRGNFSLAWLA